jgi:hypothetical protein
VRGAAAPNAPLHHLHQMHQNKECFLLIIYFIPFLSEPRQPTCVWIKNNPIKYFVYFLPIAIILFARACGKKNVKGNGTLTGKWKLVESLADPGNGSGKREPVPTSTYVQFYANGNLGGTTFPSCKLHRKGQCYLNLYPGK